MRIGTCCKSVEELELGATAAELQQVAGWLGKTDNNWLSTFAQLVWSAH